MNWSQAMPSPRAANAPLATPTRADALAVWASAAIARGDPDAFEWLYRDWFPRVVRLARAATGRDENFALDIAQDVMLRVARSMRALRDHAHLEAWMTRATLHAAVDALRAEHRRAARERRAARTTAAPARATRDLDDARWLSRALAALTSTEYEAVLLRIAQERTLKEAGLSAGVSEGVAQGRVRRVLDALRHAASRLNP
jgi:RNA polymerase sigma-70 factor, ECF subfamily